MAPGGSQRRQPSEPPVGISRRSISIRPILRSATTASPFAFARATPPICRSIKATGTDIVQRREWEDEIDGDRPKLGLARQTALAPLLSDDVEKELRPVFETSIERVIMPLHFGRSDMELAFDRGRINTPDQHLSVSEFEIELKDGDRRDGIRRIATNASRRDPGRKADAEGRDILD